MTPTELATFRAEENARYARHTIGVNDALRPWREFMFQNLTSTQTHEAESLVRKTLVEADFFANKKNLTCEVNLKVIVEGRKGSPNGVISGDVTVKVDGHISGGAGCWFTIGKRGKVQGSLRGFGFCGFQTKL